MDSEKERMHVLDNPGRHLGDVTQANTFVVQLSEVGHEKMVGIYSIKRIVWGRHRENTKR
jgi:hypothetical protein